MEWFFATAVGLCVVLLGACVWALLKLGQAIKAGNSASLQALEKSRDADAQARAATTAQINDLLHALTAGLEAVVKGVWDLRSQIETLETKQMAEAKTSSDAAKTSSDAVQAELGKSRQHLQSLVAKLEAVGPVANEIKAALEQEANKRIESHSWLATELKTEIRKLTDQIDRLKASLEESLKF